MEAVATIGTTRFFSLLVLTDVDPVGDLPLGRGINMREDEAHQLGEGDTAREGAMPRREPICLVHFLCVPGSPALGTWL